MRRCKLPQTIPYSSRYLCKLNTRHIGTQQQRKEKRCFMNYFRLLETFVLTVLMDKNEYNFFHKNFRPVKLMVVLVLTANLVFTGYLLNKLTRVHDVILDQCPTVFEKKTTPPKTRSK